jgi:hypothetical protein
MSSHLTPLEVATRALGGIEAVSVVCGRHPKSAYQWRYASGTRAAGDLPDGVAQRALLAHCAARGLPMRADWLIWGAPAAEVEAALAEARASHAA